jgi:GSCFA family protein
MPIQLYPSLGPSRYEFHLTSFAENRANLEGIYALLSEYGHPDVHIVVTVSPVPLMNTFSSTDIVVANTWAKSLLRAVAQEWARTRVCRLLSKLRNSTKLRSRRCMRMRSETRQRRRSAPYHGVVSAELSRRVRSVTWPRFFRFHP